MTTPMPFIFDRFGPHSIATIIRRVSCFTCSEIVLSLSLKFLFEYLYFLLSIISKFLYAFGTLLGGFVTTTDDSDEPIDS